MSDRPPAPATLEERTDDIRAVMDASGSERAFIFGTSEGGAMACVFAATYPEANERPHPVGDPGHVDQER